MQSKLIRLFIDHGANTKIKNQKGKTPVDLCIDNENLIGVQLLLTEIPFQTEGSNKVNKFIHYLTNLACRGKEQMKFVHQKLVQVDERKLKVQLKEEWNGFTFLVYLIKKFTETVHINFRKTYIRYMSHPSLTA